MVGKSEITSKKSIKMQRHRSNIAYQFHMGLEIAPKLPSVIP
jgi:hypothetical protein